VDVYEASGGGTAAREGAHASVLARRRRDGALLAAFLAATFTAAGLVFLVQPIAARLLLPLFGGAPAVWVTAMVFFQAVLLAGYAFAHASMRVLGPRRQPLVQLVVLAAGLAALPIGRHLDAPPADASPALWLLSMLALSVGAPYFVVTTASPVLQRWFSTTRHPAAADPYFLYAAGNVGSLLALLAYPLLVEPNLSLDEQVDLWDAGYVLFAALLVVNLVEARRRPAPPAERTATTAVPLAWRTRLRWVALAFVPSCLLVGTTTYLSTDVAAVPLLWVAPLALYLLTFVIAFARRRPLSPAAASTALLVVAPLAALSLLHAVKSDFRLVIVLHLALLFLAGVLVHGRLADERPAAERLTEYYLLLSLGGVLGGAFAALVAPVAFDSVLEYPLAIVLALALRPGGARGDGRPILQAARGAVVPVAVLAGVVALVLVGVPRGAALATAAAALLLVRARPVAFALGVGALLALTLLGSPALHQERTFFGVLRVVSESGGLVTLEHGTTVHGTQRRGSAEPLSYYHRGSPIGDVFRMLHRSSDRERVSVVGLGVGTLAAYGRPGDRFTFAEIDPAVVRIASDGRWFTYLRGTRATVAIHVGDGRRVLADAPPGSAELIVLDAFSSDAIPVHLVTREAVESYLRALTPGGLLAFHVSNQHLDLRPVLAGIGRDLGLAVLAREDRVSAVERRAAKLPSRWVVLARTPAPLEPLRRLGWRPPPIDQDLRLWTDDYSNILGILR
jgi:spermidine synthase